MQSYHVELQGSSLQLFDSANFELPEDYSVPFPVAKGYLCIPTIPDHLGDVRFDVYRNESPKNTDLNLAYKGTISCNSQKLIVETNMTGRVCEISFDSPGEKQVEVWTNKTEDPEHVAILLTE